MLVWGGSLLIARPWGDFPLDDEWAYTIAVKRLLVSGDYRPADWGNMSLVTHVLWGALFSRLLGFSFMTLRISMLVMSLAGSIGTYVLIRDCQASRWVAVAGALALAFNPLYTSSQSCS